MMITRQKPEHKSPTLVGYVPLTGRAMLVQRQMTITCVACANKRSRGNVAATVKPLTAAQLIQVRSPFGPHRSRE